MYHQLDTFGELFNRNVIKLLNLFHDKLSLVDLDNDSSTPFATLCKPKFAESVLDVLRYVYGV